VSPIDTPLTGSGGDRGARAWPGNSAITPGHGGVDSSRTRIDIVCGSHVGGASDPASSVGARRRGGPRGDVPGARSVRGGERGACVGRSLQARWWGTATDERWGSHGGSLDNGRGARSLRRIGPVRRFSRQPLRLPAAPVTWALGAGVRHTAGSRPSRARSRRLGSAGPGCSPLRRPVNAWLVPVPSAVPRPRRRFHRLGRSRCAGP
jgi:hypothetical protein